MSKFSLELADGQRVILPLVEDDFLNVALADPKAQTAEMIDQINRRHYYAELFAGKSGLTFLDLGANLGLVSIYAAPACKQVVAMEPEPHTFRLLDRLTSPLRQIQCRHAALVPESGPINLAVDDADHTCHTTTNPKPNQRSVRVPGLAFPDLGFIYLDVCKVDVEGAEMACLSTAVLQNSQVENWYLEVHKTPGHTRDANLGEMIHRLKSAGYRVSTPRENAIIARRH